ncbi:NAD(P)-binding protein [Auriscalpium vulgare]|uniref:NAD(P)-binding protein n=1 Tax=Auriscalpium vulgare TaxID=40419 RepID=A0ACB8RSG1_9AGAM|nr:NAD(P)-binding protein [Auriscalpium vulgare]
MQSSSINIETLFSLKDRVALVTGGGSGIGAYITHGLVLAGCTRVYITGRRLNALQETAKFNSAIIPVQGDVATRAGCVELARQFVEQEKAHGVSEAAVQLDILVNNAGVMTHDGTWDKDGASAEEVSKALLEASDEEWARGFAINTSSIQWLSAALLPYLVRASKNNSGFKEGRGVILNNTSVSALYVSRDAQGHIYSASKAAAESVTQNLASKFTKLGVRVNSFAPANVPSEINDVKDPKSFISMLKDVIPIGRVGNEEDMVGAIVYLASRAGSFVSGVVIKVDGGILIGV